MITMPNKLTDKEIVKALENAEYRCDGIALRGYYLDHESMKQVIDQINRLQAENKDLFYKLEGVMHSVDKWLDGDELKQDEVNRASTMREKTLKITEDLQAENEDYKALYESSKAEHLETIKAIKHYKTEAYKEVFEKLNDKSLVRKIKLFGNWFIVKGVTLHDINKLKKELVGDNDE